MKERNKKGRHLQQREPYTEQAEVRIAELDENGQGIAVVKRQKVAIKNALPDETVRIKARKGKAGMIIETMERLNESDVRCKVNCAIFERCGSCHLLHMEYQKQLEWKKQGVIKLLREAGLKGITVHDPVGMKEPYAYRNKVIIGFQKNRARKTIAGFYEEESHRIVAFHDCLLQDAKSNELVRVITELVNEMHIAPYEEDRRSGVLRHVLIRRGFASDQTMVVFVTNTSMFAGSKNLVAALRKRCPYITTIVQNINTRKTSIVLGEQEKVLFGKGYIEDVLCGLRFRISPKSFYQINHEQCEKLYAKAKELAQPACDEILLDAYCGIGTIGMSMAKEWKAVYGVEVNRDAVRDAKSNALRNKIDHITFICEDAGRFLTDTAKRGWQPDVLIMDPSRAGSDLTFLRAVNKAKPKRIVYISCNPKTQVRDLLELAKLGYQTKDLYLYDLFPNTTHTESICLLNRKS